MTEYLKFGDLVLIYGVSSRKSDNINKGLLSSTGYTDHSVYLDAMEYDIIQETDLSINQFSNLRDCVYQIQPKLNFQIHKEIQTLEKQKKNAYSQISRMKTTGKEFEIEGEDFTSQRSIKTEKDVHITFQQISKRIQKTEKRLKNELEQNKKIIESSVGSQVSYGQEVFLMHYDSKQYLQSQVQVSETEQSGYKFIITKHLSKSMIFKIQPRYKLRQEGEPIQYKDTILIQNIKLNCLINFNPNNIVVQDKSIAVSKEEPYHRTIKGQRDQSRKRYECFLNNSQEVLWQFILYNPQQTTNQIQGGDIIMLKHTELNGYLHADFSYNNNFQESYIRLYDGPYEEELESALSYWEIEKESNNCKGEPLLLSEPIQKKENEEKGKEKEKQKGNEKEKDPGKEKEKNKTTNFKLRHLITGKLLNFVQTKVNGQQMSIPYLGEESKGETSKINFIQTGNQNSPFLIDNFCYYIKLNNFPVCAENEIQYKFAPPVQKKTDQTAQMKMTFTKISKVSDDKIFESLRDEEFETTRIAVICNEKGTTESNAFQIIKVNEEFKNNSLFLKSAVGVLEKYVNLIQTKSDEFKTNKKMIHLVIQALKSLIFFPIKTEDTDPLECDGIQIVQRQRMLKDFRVIDTLMDLAYYPFRYDLLDLSNIQEQSEEILLLFRLVYRLILQSIKEYRPSELYASQWLELMIRHAKLGGSVIGAEKTLTELIDNNKKILETKISSRIINSFLIMLSDRRKSNQVSMVRALCVCDGEAMVFNQGEISNFILKEESIDHLLYKLVEQEGSIYIQLDENLIKLSEFPNISQETDEGENYEYYLQMIELLADLCLGRNYIAIEKLELIFPLELIVKIIIDQEQSYLIRKAFVRLIMSLWVDRAPYYKIILPDRIRLWKDIDNYNDNQIPSSINNFNEFQSLKSFGKKFLDDIVKLKYQRAYQTDVNQLTITSLELLKLMLQCGFYKSLEEIKEFVQPIIVLLNGTKDIIEESEEQTKNVSNCSIKMEDKEKNVKRYEDTENNRLIMKCKALGCEILQIIVQFIDFTRVNVFLKYYKQFKHPAGENQRIKEDFVGWVEQIIQSQKLKILGEHQMKGICIFFDLNMYQSADLSETALSFIGNYHSQRLNMINQLLDIQLIEDPIQVQIYRNLSKVSVSLGELVEKSEQYMWIETPSAQQSIDKIILILQFVADSLVSNENLDLNQSIDFDSSKIIISSNQPVYQLFPDGCTYNPFTQQLIKNQQIYRSVLEYLKFEADNFSLNRENDPTYNVQSDTLKSMKLCYLILARFVYKNSCNQAILLDYLDSVFIKHLRTIPEADVHLVLVPLLTENVNVLFNDQILRRFLKSAVYTINNISPNNRLKPAYFEILTIVTKFKNRVIKSNQTQVINEISHRDYPSIVVTYSEPSKFNIFKSLVEDLDKKIEQNNEEININPELDYFNGFMYLMSIICEDKNNATESKAQTYFKLDHLKLLLKIAGDNYYIKSNLIFFFYHVYLDTEREVTDELIEMKSSLISSVQNDLKQLFSTQQHDSIVFLTYQGRRTYQQIKLTYYFESLLLVVESLIINRMLENQMVDQFVKDLIDSLKQVQKLEIKYYIKGFRSILSVILRFGLVQKNDLQAIFPLDFLPTAEEKAQKIYICKQEEISNVKVSNEFQQEIEEKIVQQHKLQESITKEFGNLINIISNIEEISSEQLESKGTISTSEFLDTLISQIKKGAGSSIQNQILRSKILRKFIENAFVEEIRPAVQWEPESFNFIQSKLKAQQKKLVQQGVVEMLVEVMKKEQNEELFREYIWLGVALLIGQNRNAQEIFNQKLQEDESNLFLNNLYSRVNQLFGDISKNMKLLNKKRFNQLCNIQIEEVNIQNDPEEEGHKKVNNVEVQEEQTIFYNKITQLSEIYLFLGMLCDGHYQEAQLFMSSQNHTKSYDFVLQAATQFVSFTKFCNIESLKLGKQLMMFMIICSQGPCFKNQQQLVRGKTIESCKELLQKFDNEGELLQAGFITNEDKNKVNELATQSGTLLLALIEGGEDKEIISHMCLTLDFDFLFQKMRDEYFKLAKTLGIQDDEDVTIENVTEALQTVYSDQMLNVFSIMILILQLELYNPDIKDLKESYLQDNSVQGKDISQAIRFFQKNTKSIEIIVNNVPVLVYFPVQPVCKFLSKTSRTKLMYEVPRNTTSEKVQYLINETEGFIEEMDHSSYLQRLPFYFGNSRFEMVKLIATALAYIICILMVASDSKGFNKTYDGGVNVYSKFHNAIVLFSWIQFGFSLAIMVFYFFIKVPLVLKRKWRQLIEKNIKKYGEQPDLDQINSDQTSPMDLELKITLRLLEMKGPYAAIFNQGIVRNMGNLFTFAFYYWKNIKFLFGEGDFNFFIFYIILSSLARFYSELVYAFLLLDIISQSATLQNVIKSVTNNTSMLCMIGILSIILSYIYASIIYYFQNDIFSVENILMLEGTYEAENGCTTLWQCFCVTYLYGMILGAGIGDFGKTQSYNHETRNKYYSKLVIDWSFFVIFKLVILTLIFSAIIETFRVLKENRYKVEDDMSANCYICGIERGQFEQFADGFENHTERDHNAWNYVYYIYYVTRLKKSMRNGIESMVANKFIIKETNWLPVHKARSLISRQEGNTMKEIEEILLKTSEGMIIKEDEKE